MLPGFIQRRKDMEILLPEIQHALALALIISPPGVRLIVMGRDMGAPILMGNSLIPGVLPKHSVHRDGRPPF